MEVIRFTYVHYLSKRFSHRGTEAQRERGTADNETRIQGLHTDLTDFRGFCGFYLRYIIYGFTRIFMGFCRGRIYPSRGMHVRQFGGG
ncbi:MAG: hypothetical protein FWG87_00740 [Defluviitaleaceae bacterium]|nr:hypothetical protein [Defluviitaleaceae bacterium]